jgi:hypothetical protein
VAPVTLAVQKFCQLVGPMGAAVDSMYARNNLLRQTRDLLLPRLVGGEISVNGL